MSHPVPLIGCSEESERFFPGEPTAPSRGRAPRVPLRSPSGDAGVVIGKSERATRPPCVGIWPYATAGPGAKRRGQDPVLGEVD